MNRKILVLAASALALSGCAAITGAPYERPGVTARADTFSAAMDVPPGYSGLTWAQQDLVDGVAAEYFRAGRGPVVIAYPVNAGNADAAVGAIAEARTRLFGAGIGWEDITGTTYDASGREQAPVLISFLTHTPATAPCPQGWRDLRPGAPGERAAHFGCATSNNFAAMVADPGDFAAPGDFSAIDLARRATVLALYRQGQSTATERDDSESGAVSTAVN